MSESTYTHITAGQMIVLPVDIPRRGPLKQVAAGRRVVVLHTECKDGQRIMTVQTGQNMRTVSLPADYPIEVVR